MLFLPHHWNPEPNFPLSTACLKKRCSSFTLFSLFQWAQSSCHTYPYLLQSTTAIFEGWKAEDLTKAWWWDRAFRLPQWRDVHWFQRRWNIYLFTYTNIYNETVSFVCSRVCEPSMGRNLLRTQILNRSWCLEMGPGIRSPRNLSTYKYPMSDNVQYCWQYQATHCGTIYVN